MRTGRQPAQRQDNQPTQESQGENPDASPPLPQGPSYKLQESSKHCLAVGLKRQIGKDIVIGKAADNPAPVIYS